VWEVEDPQPLSMLTNLKIISNIFFLNAFPIVIYLDMLNILFENI
jgi:hypothetical protein